MGNTVKGTMAFLLVAMFCVLRPLVLSPQLNKLIASSLSSNRQMTEDGTTEAMDLTAEMSVMDQEISSIVSTQDHEVTAANNNTTQRAFYIICMGEMATESRMVERFVYSLRNVGEFPGWIILLTDAPDSRYESILDWTENFVVMHPEDEDYIQNYTAKAMRFKQFKTYVLEYMSQDERLDDVELIYYLDVDIIIGNSVWPMFQELEARYHIGPSSDPPKMWMFEGNFKNTKIQGGQMILHREASKPCLTRFRSLMDPINSTIDQVHLMQMYQEQNEARALNQTSSLQCEIVIMPQESHLIQFPETRHIRKIAEMLQNGKALDRNKFPVLNHFKNTGNTVKKTTRDDLQLYLRYLLRFERGQVDQLCITNKMLLHEPSVTCNPKPSFNRTSMEFQTDGVERVLFAISMGEKAANSKIVERFIWSARNVGLYPGWIVIMTDAEDDRYQDVYNWTNNVIFLKPEENDIKDHYNTTNMAFKRFKTMVLDYIDKETILKNVELAYYLDIDIVFGAPLLAMFNGLERKYGIGERNITATDLNHQIGAKSKMWMFEGNSEKWPVQGGQMILDRRLSRGCQTKWRSMFDRNSTTEMSKDQWLLLEILQEMQDAKELKNISNLECEIGVMAQKPYLEFPRAREMRRKNAQLGSGKIASLNHAPMVHIRNDGGVGELPFRAIKYYMRDLLKYEEGERDTLGIATKMEMETTKKKKAKKVQTPQVDSNETKAIFETNETTIETYNVTHDTAQS
jgi:hypothetical protein